MIEFIRDGGVIMIPLLVITLVVAALTVRSSLRVRHGAVPPDAVVETGIDAVLFWGVYGVVLGVLGTVVGIAQAAKAIERIGEVSDVLVWGGIKVALHPTIFGLCLFSVALLLWFALRVRYRRRVAVEA